MKTQTPPSQQLTRLTSLRAQTLQLLDLATSEDSVQREPMPGFRPILWHLAHIGVFQNYWIIQRAAGMPSLNPTYDVHFDPMKTPREEARRLPARAEMEAYLQATLSRVHELLENGAADAGRARNGAIDMQYAIELTLEHERQHQETIAFLFAALPYESKKAGPPPLSGTRRTAPQEIHIPALRVPIGGTRTRFVYDNELPGHEHALSAFLIDRDLTTNAEYAEFVEAGGYGERRFWSDEGWAWKESAAADKPLYWSGPPWKEHGFFQEVALRDDTPVSGISWFEADAYARFRGKRLPTEFEWEAAAAWDPNERIVRAFPWGEDDHEEDRSAPDANANNVLWSTAPVGAYEGGNSPLGLHDAAGNLWEWTASPFAGYPGFAAYPYPEYSETWFDGDHRVSRGGSWFSATSLLRTTFRNFYRRNFRAALIGMRCARDAR
jgi:gamma-glutamyl hercynylcysteine S-oxide synthase